MATTQHTRPLSPQDRPFDERTPLLPNVGPSGQTSRKQKRGSRSSSKRKQKSIDESECSCSDVESLTRSAYSTSSGPSQKSMDPGCSRATRSCSSVTSTTAYDRRSSSKAPATNAQDCQERYPVYDGEDVTPRSEAWSFFTSIFTAYDSVSLRLENSGSVARDHLASERTFLAYMRTSLAIASAGVGKRPVPHLFRDNLSEANGEECGAAKSSDALSDCHQVTLAFSLLRFFRAPTGIKTLLTPVSVRLALVQLFSAAASSAPEGSTHRLHTYIRPLGASTIGMGIIVLLIGMHAFIYSIMTVTKKHSCPSFVISFHFEPGFVRYFTIQAALTKGYFPVSRITTGLIAMMLSVLVTVTFAVLLSGKLEPRRQ